jgi:hypothetical protein
VNGKQYPGNGLVQPIFPKDQGEMVNDQACRQKKFPNCCTAAKKNLDKFNLWAGLIWLLRQNEGQVDKLQALIFHSVIKAGRTIAPSSASSGPAPSEKWFERTIVFDS